MSPSSLKYAIESQFDSVPNRCTSDELVIICFNPACHDAGGNRSVRLSTGQTNCWRCGVAGSIKNVAKKFGFELDYANAPAPTISEVDLLLNEVNTQKAAPSGYIPSVDLPKGFRKIADYPTSAYADLIAEMAERKWLTFEDLAAAGVGYTKEDSYWEPFAIFPVFEWDRPVYYQGRTYTDPERDPLTGKRPSTKKFPSRRECPLGSRYWLYGIDELRRKKGQTVIIVEAILNVLSLRRELKRRGISGVVPLAVFKHTVSPDQARKLLSLHPGEVCIMFDGDATESAHKDASRLMNSCKTSVAEMPVGIDPNDDARLAVDLFLERKPHGRLSDLVL
jgi:hypothetical protein